MTSKRYDVLALGNAIVDVIATAEEDFLASHELVKGSMALIDEARAEALYAAMGPGKVISGGSAANTIAGLMAALTTGTEAWGPRTALNLPALSTTVGDITAALGRVAGPAALDLLDWQPDERIAAIVGAWPSRFHAARAHGLGLLPDASVDALVAQYVAEHRAAITLPLN